MDNDRLWLWPGRQSPSPAPAVCGHCREPDRLCAWDVETLRERADLRWPLVVVIEGGDVSPTLPLVARACSGTANRWRSPCAFCCSCGDVRCCDRFVVAATFLKVTVHFTSSPAKTVWSCHWMKTRMLLWTSGGMVERAETNRPLSVAEECANGQVTAAAAFPLGCFRAR